MQVIRSSTKRREAEAVNISIARKLLDLCVKHDSESVTEALDHEGVTIDEYLAQSA